ncbi:MAG TPA: hypothetical protein DEF01_08450 [Gemmatimonadetes bacterium]|nr:hypothetical protein [Gemmatimonadota bacterium]
MTGFNWTTGGIGDGFGGGAVGVDDSLPQEFAQMRNTKTLFLNLVAWWHAVATRDLCRAEVCLGPRLSLTWLRPPRRSFWFFLDVNSRITIVLT